MIILCSVIFVSQRDMKIKEYKIFSFCANMAAGMVIYAMNSVQVFPTYILQ